MAIYAVSSDSKARDRAKSDGIAIDPESATESTAVEASSSGPAPRRYRRRIVQVVVAALLLAFLAMLWSWAAYQSQHVMSRNAMVRGQITEVGTRFNGVLAAIEVDEGARVPSGQVLARLEDRHLRAEALELQARIEGLEREVELERSTIAHERLKQEASLQESVARAAVARAEVATTKSRADEAREYHKVRQDLLGRRMISSEDERQAEARYRTALALVDVALANQAAAESATRGVRLESAGLDLREQRLEVLLANVRAAKARLVRAQADLEGALIRAPGDGAVIRWLIKPGGSVEVGKPVVSMSIGRDVWIEAWIDEDQIHRVKLGGAVVVTLPSHPGREFDGVVDKIGLTTDFEQPLGAVPQPRAERMRGAPVVGVLVRLQDAPATLLPGLSATVAIRDEGR